jgi:flagellar protein FlaG
MQGGVMKIEGMDAANNNFTAPAQAAEQTQVKNTPDGAVKAKSSEGSDHSGSAGKTIIKVRIATENPTIEKNIQQNDGASDEIIRESIERANRMLFGNDRKFEISIHEKTGDIMVKVVDTRTNEIIREIPPQKIVDLVVHLCEIAGILYDKKG